LAVRLTSLLPTSFPIWPDEVFQSLTFEMHEMVIGVKPIALPDYSFIMIEWCIAKGQYNDVPQEQYNRANHDRLNKAVG
jgi:hypothetical protein